MGRRSQSQVAHVMVRGVLVNREHVPAILVQARRTREEASKLGDDTAHYDEIIQRLEEAQEEPCPTSRS